MSIYESYIYDPLILIIIGLIQKYHIHKELGIAAHFISSVSKELKANLLFIIYLP